MISKTYGLFNMFCKIFSVGSLLNCSILEEIQVGLLYFCCTLGVSRTGFCKFHY